MRAGGGGDWGGGKRYKMNKKENKLSIIDEKGNIVSKDLTQDIVNNTIAAFLEGITGIVTSERKELLLSFGYLLQRIRGVGFLQALSNEWKKFREKGKFKDDYTRTEQCKSSLQILLDCLDKDSPDERRFFAMKAIFITSAFENIQLSDRESPIPQQLMKLCRNLDSGEILVLRAAYKIAQEKETRGDISAGEWLSEIANKSGLGFNSLVEVSEDRLIEKHLISPRRYGDRSGVSLGKHFRLTGLGFRLCQFIEYYELESSK